MERIILMRRMDAIEKLATQQEIRIKALEKLSKEYPGVRAVGCELCVKFVRCPGMLAIGEQGTECKQYVAKESV